MPPKSDDRSDIQSSVGRRIKTRRKDINMTLGELAIKTGLTASFISQVERGKASLSLTSLHTLADSLDVPVLHFLTEDDNATLNPPSAEPESAQTIQSTPPYNPVTYPGRRKHLVFPDTGVTLELIVPSLGQKMVSFKGSLTPGKSHPAARLREPTEEMIYILAGTLKLDMTDGSYILHRDESIYFEGQKLLLMTCVSENEDAVWISAITPAVF